ncbi:MAG: excinuclease ABC subunit UvrA [Paludibacteraceae bacterium]|jgi:excinuclease ABC subunit A|nr:excinuclease ABC subunit UvrA [Paludibacteraceae bacterium]
MSEKVEEQGRIEVLGARVHNLRNIDVSIPRYALTVVTGLSGSGKSSLAFDTIYAEGQRRYIDTFSAYARQFIGNMERPDVDKISGLSPVIAIEQKTTNRNPRSTVGTTTEIYDFLRLLFARAGEAYSYVTGEKMVKYSEEQILHLIFENYSNKACYLLAPIVKGRKGHYKELFETIRRKGYLNVRVDGEMRQVVFGMKLDRYKTHDIDVVVDKLVVNEKDEKRLRESVKIAMQQGDGVMMIMEKGSDVVRYFSRQLMCPTTGLAYSDPAPYNFSFNTPKGACPTCKGLGVINRVDIDKIIPDKHLSIAQGAIVPLGKEKNSLVFWQLSAIGEKYGFTLHTPIEEISAEGLDEILNGTTEQLRIRNKSLGESTNYFTSYEGIIHYIEMEQENSATSSEQKWANQFSKTVTCPTCGGSRLNAEALSYRIADKNIADLSAMDLTELSQWVKGVSAHLTEKQQKIAKEILKEIFTRLQFLLNVGLGYLSLNRDTASLSGGESQRIRLGTQIGSQLVNVLYILDEPSIGLHPRDNIKLIDTLKKLRDLGNSIIVVEHDEDMMRSADYIVDLGPRAGRLGGELVFQGTVTEMLQRDTLTSSYLNGLRKIEVPAVRRQGNGKKIILKGACGNNLKNVNLEIPLGMFVCVTGVSGSGKSSLINSTLQPILSHYFYRSEQEPLPYKSIEGIEFIDKVVRVDQSPIGRTPRSNPVTYTGIFNDIRNLFATLPEAKMRGYKPGRFSFNTNGGRCEVCKGNGYKTLEMNFLPDVMVPCEACHGTRYNRETLEVRFKGKSIANILDMTINQAVEFFENMPTFIHKLKTLQDVGLGYVKLGQSSTTLSGGESQRIKLATELSKRDTGKTLYILDEPTTGLHFEDIRVLLSVLERLLKRGNTVVVVEHNLDIIKCADWIIDMGPEGGKAGGQIIAQGTPEQVAEISNSFTAPYLKKIL